MEEQKFQERRKVKDNNQQTENSLACARGMTYAYGDTCVSSKCLSDHACAHGRARRPFTKAEIAAWRERIFADGVEDPQACSRDGKHVSDDLPEPPLPPRPAVVDT